MLVYRIAKGRHIRDLTGEGARLSGGRWNRKGTSIIYTSESRALAALEFLVHVSPHAMPVDLKIAAFRIPDDIIPDSIPASKLPRSWKRYPARVESAQVGTDWARKNSSLLLRVPSALISEEFNILINPENPRIKEVRIAEVKEFEYDERLVGRGG